jgi:alkanesulfonate monooxygenase SsuD/methylene tetrahydromethanopterin reductase-like flavin-dependent oxidoreductase (luciferase family)
MFRTYFFTEMPYPHVPQRETIPSVRTSIPNRWFNPDTGAELFKRYLDLYMAADDMGFDLMVNEHHSTATCLNSVLPLHLAILARETKRGRLLALGNPVANRPDPVRVAEEMATIDVISQGRLDCGVIRGSIPEITPTNTNPMIQRERMWEATDLITAAWTHHDGPFSWEGRHFSHRQVNIWPRPYQQPHPPLWVTTVTPSSAAELARRDITIATIIIGSEAAAEIFNAYRATAAELGRPEPPPEKFAYCALGFVGETDEAGYEGLDKLLDFYRFSEYTPWQYLNVPGYLPPHIYAEALKGELQGVENRNSHVAEVMVMGKMPIEQHIAEGRAFAGSPDTVFEQIRDFYHRVGGCANILLMMHATSMASEYTLRSMRLFADEVLPRLRTEVYEPHVRDGALALAH